MLGCHAYDTQQFEVILGLSQLIPASIQDAMQLWVVLFTTFYLFFRVNCQADTLLGVFCMTIVIGWQYDLHF